MMTTPTSAATANSANAAAPAEPRITRIELIALLAVVVLAAGLRFGWPGVNGFAWDEARIALDALRMARGGEFVMAGQPSSVDIPFFPLSVWLFALPFAISPDPLFATLTVAAVGVLCTVGVWSLARTWGRSAGLIAALLWAAAPFAVLYSRSIWQPNLLAPIALAWMLACAAALRRPGRGGLIGAFAVGAIGGMAVQVHFAGAALTLATAWVLVRHLRGRRLIALVIGGAAAIVTALPYLYYVTAVDPRVADRFGAALGSGETVYDLAGFAALARLALQWEWGFLGLGEGDPHGTALLPVLIVGALVVIGGLVLLRSARRTPIAEIALVTALASPLFFIRHSSPVLIHYALIALPAVVIAGGAAVSALDRRAWRIGIGTAAIVLAGVWTFQLADTLARVSIERPPNSALSSILRESREAALAPAEPILVFTHGDTPSLHGEAAVFAALLWPRDHRILNGDSQLILPPYPATLLATLAPFQMWEELGASGLASDVTEFPRRAPALPFMAARYDGAHDPSGFTAIDPVALNDGTTLIGWRTRRVGDRLRISTLWQVNGDAPPGIYQAFHHLRPADADPDSPPLASDVALTRGAWRAGDRVIIMADYFDIPAGGRYTIAVGRYTLPDLARIARTDGLEDGAIRLGQFIS